MAITLPRTGSGIAQKKTSNPASRATNSPSDNTGIRPPETKTIPRSTLDRGSITAQPTNRSADVLDRNKREFGTAQEEMFKILTRASQQFASDVLFSVDYHMFRVSGSLIKDNFCSKRTCPRINSQHAATRSDL